MTKKLTAKELSKLELSVYTSGGFTLWCVEKIRGKDGKMFESKHWIFDASLLREDGEIRLGSPRNWKINLTYRKSTNSLILSKGRRSI